MPKKTKIHGHGWWHRRLDKKLGDWLRETHNECAWCHKPGYLTTSHVKPKGKYQGLRYDLMNVLPMHGNCHIFEWHANPTESGKWFEENYPERAVYLEEAKKVFVKRDQAYYEKVDKALDEKDAKSLLVLDKA